MILIFTDSILRTNIDDYIIEMSNYEFFFKQTYTNKVKHYRVSTNSTITQFICDIKNKAYVDFDIDTHDTVMKPDNIIIYTDLHPNWHPK
jgi:hypothetical protein